MRIINLMENTKGAEGCVWEHGLSFYIETKKHKLLADTGASEAFLKNAVVLGIDLRRVDTVILSHGHYDHGGGLAAFAVLNPRAGIWMHRGAGEAYYHKTEQMEKYIGISPEIIEKPKPGRYSYDNMLSYLTHIKYVDKIQYAPEDVVTLAGSDYMDYYNERKKRWIKAREIVAKKGGKTRDRLFRETMEKLDRGELTYNEIALTKGGCALLTDSKYQKKLFTKSGLVTDLAGIHHQNMKKMIENGEINSWEQIEKSEQFKLLQCYGYIEELKNTLEAAIKKGVQNEFLNLKQAIKEYKINPLVKSMKTQTVEGNE